MINLDRSLPMVIPQPKVSLISPYGTEERFVEMMRNFFFAFYGLCAEVVEESIDRDYFNVWVAK